jgi:hypothetical protein
MTAISVNIALPCPIYVAGLNNIADITRLAAITTKSLRLGNAHRRILNLPHIYQYMHNPQSWVQTAS